MFPIRRDGKTLIIDFGWIQSNPNDDKMPVRNVKVPIEEDGGIAGAGGISKLNTYVPCGAIFFLLRNRYLDDCPASRRECIVRIVNEIGIGFGSLELRAELLIRLLQLVTCDQLEVILDEVIVKQGIIRGKCGCEYGRRSG